MKKHSALLLALTCLVSCSNTNGNSSTSSVINHTYPAFLENEVITYSDALKDSKVAVPDTFYEIFVGSFSDSNGDGIGDLRGIINRFDYLNDGLDSGRSLGVTGIWLMPIFTGSSYHKYDTTDYYQVDPTYGTIEDFKELAALCKERGVKLIIDLALNHSSSSHPWFKEFKEAILAEDPSNKYYDYYVHKTEEEKESGKKYNSIPRTDVFYECNFDGGMPEFNFDNPEVVQEFKNIGKYWLDLGADGFRFDAAKYVYLDDTIKNVAFWKDYMAYLKSVKEDVFCVGEVWANESISSAYYENFPCFDFSMADSGGHISSCAKGSRPVTKYLNTIESFKELFKKSNPEAIPTPFISNHDMDRAAGFLSISSGQAYTAASLMLLSRSTPFLYYGEEIGLKGSRGSAQTDADRRLKMRWGDDDTVKNPIGSTYPEGSQINGTVIEHVQNPNSLYNHYKRLLQARKAYPEITLGDYEVLNSETSTFGGFIATHNSKSVAVFHNTATTPLEVNLKDLDARLEKMNLKVSFHNESSLNASTLTIAPQSSVILA